MRTLTTLTTLTALGAAALLATGCTPDKVIEAASTGSTSAPTATAAPTAAPPPSLAPPPVAKVDFAENDFVESDRNRDPFRSFVAIFAPEPTKRLRGPQLALLLPQYSLDELKLVAIVTRGDYPRAMVVDPNGKGWVIKRGDWIGRPEIVHTGGTNGADYQLNWRVDKVRDGDVVFSREDPANPAVPPASRVISLHPEADQKQAQNLTD
jgi:type IV pilus assembly protein PilP